MNVLIIFWLIKKFDRDPPKSIEQHETYRNDLSQSHNREAIFRAAP